jgi:hypothetical protein
MAWTSAEICTVLSLDYRLFYGITIDTILSRLGTDTIYI